jgi:hypothetical protein
MKNRWIVFLTLTMLCSLVFPGALQANVVAEKAPSRHLARGCPWWMRVTTLKAGTRQPGYSRLL